MRLERTRVGGGSTKLSQTKTVRTYILDRKKDLIVTGDFNVFPREIEDVLSTHADVAMVAVIGVPDEKWGEAVTAMIVLRNGARPEAAELIELVKSRKGSVQAPKSIEFVTASDDPGRQGRQKGAAGKVLGGARSNGGLR